MERSWGLVSTKLKMVNQCLQYPVDYHPDSPGFPGSYRMTVRSFTRNTRPSWSGPRLVFQTHPFLLSPMNHSHPSLLIKSPSFLNHNPLVLQEFRWQLHFETALTMFTLKHRSFCSLFWNPIHLSAFSFGTSCFKSVNSNNLLMWVILVSQILVVCKLLRDGA